MKFIEFMDLTHKNLKQLTIFVVTYILMIEIL